MGMAAILVMCQHHINIFVSIYLKAYIQNLVKTVRWFLRKASFNFHIMKTYPCNVNPLTPHFCIVKLGFTGVYIIFLFFL